jgi:hypothetical protein
MALLLNIPKIKLTKKASEELLENSHKIEFKEEDVNQVNDFHEDEGLKTFKNTEAIYSGSVKIIDYGFKPLTGMTAKLGLIDTNQNENHPFKGMATGSGSGHRLQIVLSEPKIDEEELRVFLGESMLTWWSEDCLNGMVIKIKFDSGPDGIKEHPLYGYEANRKTGEIIYMTCWAISENETLQDPLVAKKTRKLFTNLTAVQQSHIKCQKDIKFQNWCYKYSQEIYSIEILNRFPNFELSKQEYSEYFVKYYCNIISRKTLNEDTIEGHHARKKWQEILRKFDAYTTENMYKDYF